MSKFIAQIIVQGARIVGRAFNEAIKKEWQASQAAATQRGDGASSASSSRRAAGDMYAGMTLQEAKQILNVSEIESSETITKSYDHLFTVNDKSKGGSLYLQSKVVRAKERIEMEFAEQEKKKKKSESPPEDSPKE